MLTDPLKLIPLVGAVGVLILIGMGKLDANQAIAILGATVGIHAAISAVSNVNPPKDQGR